VDTAAQSWPHTSRLAISQLRFSHEPEGDNDVERAPAKFDPRRHSVNGEIIARAPRGFGLDSYKVKRQ
jgi:hypothetical protein